MKKLLFKAVAICVIVLFMPFILTLLLTDNDKEVSYFDNIDFDIYQEINGELIKIPFDNYIIGVVAANMPAGYNLEALKVQAVITRTYALYNIALLKEEDTHKNSFSPSELGLSYISPSDMERFWGSDEYLTSFTKIENAVYATKNEILVCNGELILPVFFYCGTGYTRNASEAWGIDISYLRSVPSKQDVTSINYLKITEYEIPHLIQIINNMYPDIEISTTTFFEDVIIQERDSTDYVTKVNLGNQTISGEEFAKAIGVNSNHFSIEEFDGKVRFICTGVGHGVGLSQYGSNAMAGEGYSYDEILSHYYSGTIISNLDK